MSDTKMIEKLKWSCDKLIKGGYRKNKKKYKNIEKEWGINIISKNTNQWTTNLGENLVKEVFENKGYKIWKPVINKGNRPDWETNDYIIEVKTRNWTTTGTAGEKVLGCPLKYAEIPRLYNKPLLIICVAYQEWELKYSSDNMKIFGKVSSEKKRILNLFKELNIRYIPFTSLVKSRLPFPSNQVFYY